MKKTSLLLCIVIFFAVYGYVSAQTPGLSSGTARFEALGSSPFVMDAATDINNNPAWSNYYRNYAFGDLGRNALSDFELSNQYAGVTFGLGKFFNLGFIFNKEDGLWNEFRLTNISHFNPDTLGINAPIVPLKGIFGISFSKDIHFGFAPYLSMWSRTINFGPEYNYSTSVGEKQSGYDKVDLKSSRIASTLGLLWLFKGGWFEFASKFGLNSYKSDFKYNYSGTFPGANAYDTSATLTYMTESKGGFEVNLSSKASFTINQSNKLSMIPYANFVMYSWNPSFDGRLTIRGRTNLDSTLIRNPENLSLYKMTAGLGLNLPITDDIFIAGGVSFDITGRKATYDSAFSSGGNSYSLKRTFKYTEISFPMINLSGEIQMTDWLTGRVGYFRSVVYQDDMNETNVNTTLGSNTFTWAGKLNNTLSNNTNPVQTISIGVGMKFGRFCIDGTLSERWLKEGVNFISGKQNDLFGVLSMSYNFNNK